RRFKKYVMRSKKFKAHDENNECRIGDKVLIEETRPLSKEKCWQVKEILGRAV
ncbi:30S ribosomal protein S17, partial [bacterium]